MLAWVSSRRTGPRILVSSNKDGKVDGREIRELHQTLATLTEKQSLDLGELGQLQYSSSGSNQFHFLYGCLNQNNLSTRPFEIRSLYRVPVRQPV